MSLETKINALSKKINKMIQTGFWHGFVVGMYPSQFAYKPIKVDFNSWRKVREVNLYYHIPFCKWKCSYCTFFMTLNHDDELSAKYIDKVNEHFNFINSYFEEPMIVKSICFGGGTPNSIPVDLYEKIFDTLRNGNVIFHKDLEPSMEISPEIIDEQYIKRLGEIGIKRVSLGIQSLKEELRNSINRKENLNIYDIVDILRKYNMNINFDVMYGLEGQTEETFMDTLKELVKLAPETFSIYPLAGSKSSMFKKKDTLMTTKEKYQLFDVFYDYLTNNGYDCESHVKFIKKNQHSTHQQKIYEYQGTPTLGLGCGARSYNEQVHYTTAYTKNGLIARKFIDEYIEKDYKDLQLYGFEMNGDENKRRTMIYAFFMGKLDRKIYFDKYGTDALQDFPVELGALLQNDLIEIKDNEISLTRKGRKYTDLVGSIFWSERVESMYSPI